MVQALRIDLYQTSLTVLSVHLRKLGSAYLGHPLIAPSWCIVRTIPVHLHHRGANTGAGQIHRWDP